MDVHGTEGNAVQIPIAEFFGDRQKAEQSLLPHGWVKEGDVLVFKRVRAISGRHKKLSELRDGSLRKEAHSGSVAEVQAIDAPKIVYSSVLLNAFANGTEKKIAGLLLTAGWVEDPVIPSFYCYAE